MDPIYLHAKRVNATFLALVKCAKDESEDQDIRDEAYDRIARWPKTHTFCIKNDADAIRVTWAKVFSGDRDVNGDIFSKKEGKRISEQKMARLILKPSRTKISLDEANAMLKRECEVDEEDYIPMSVRQFLFKYLPACVADTLPWYLQRAVAYYKIENNKKLIIEASSEKEEYHSWKESRKRISIETTTNEVLKLK